MRKFKFKQIFFGTMLSSAAIFGMAFQASGDSDNMWVLNYSKNYENYHQNANVFLVKLEYNLHKSYTSYSKIEIHFETKVRFPFDPFPETTGKLTLDINTSSLHSGKTTELNSVGMLYDGSGNKVTSSCFQITPSSNKQSLEIVCSGWVHPEYTIYNQSTYWYINYLNTK